MRRFLLLAPLVIVLLTAATPGSQHAPLPKGAIVLASMPVKDSGGDVAVAYRTTADFVGVEEPSNGSIRLVWSQRAAGQVERLKAASHGGVFFILSTQRSPNKTCVEALDVKGNKVQDALSGAASAVLCGDRGVSLGRNRLVVSQSDTAHKGSVPYRFQSTYTWAGSRLQSAGTIRLPDYPANKYPVPNGTITTGHGDLVLIKLEVASTEAQRELGLMYRKSLDPDSGMVFVWTQPTQEGFWMENTYLPLTVAFLDANGKILQTIDMAPLTTTVHTPNVSYSYALEVNLGFFKNNGIEAGDTVQLHLK